MSELPMLERMAEAAWNFFSRQRKSKKEEKKKAIRAFLSAIRATKEYLAKLEEGTPPTKEAYRKNSETEHNLSELWHKAMEAMHPVNPELAHRFFLKCVYWADSRMWEDAR